MDGFAEMGSEQKQKHNNSGAWRAEVDTSAPIESVMEAVSRFGGIGFWKPQPDNSCRQPSQTNSEQILNPAKVEDLNKHFQNDRSTEEERETLEILKEIEATKTRFEELQAKLQKSEAKANAHPSKDQNNDGAQVELSKAVILKRVKEASEDVKQCTKVLEEVLSRVEAAKNSSYLDSGVPVMSIGQILSRKLILAEEHSKKGRVRWKISLGQILSKAGNGQKRGDCGGGCGGGDGVMGKRFRQKRMKLGFGGISFLAAKKKTGKQSR